MEKRTLTCINCPLGCQIEVILDGGTVQSITGNTCKRGAQYAEKEVTHPTRIVTTSVAVTGSKTGAHTVSCKTASDIPKDMEDYCNAKGKLFRMCDVGCVNADDPWTPRLIKNATCRLMCYSTKSAADLMAEYIALHSDGVEFDAVSGGERAHVRLGIGPAFVALVPCVALGNAVYALIFGLLVRAFLLKKKALAAIISMALGAVLKFLALYIVLVKLVAPNVVPQAKYATVTAAFTWPQLSTTLRASEPMGGSSSVDAAVVTQITFRIFRSEPRRSSSSAISRSSESVS